MEQKGGEETRGSWIERLITVVDVIKLFWRKSGKSRCPLKPKTARNGHFKINKQF